MIKTVAVILINRNGGDWLSRALTGLRGSFECNERLDWACELIIVDNDSSDDSLKRVDTILKTATFPWKVVTETKLGVNFARNAGLSASSSEYVIFTDNDLEFSENWLEEYILGFAKFPAARVFAGRVLIGKVEGSVPPWLDLEGPYSWPSIVVRCDNGDNDLTARIGDGAYQGPVGPNMGFRRSIFDSYGLFDVDFGLRPGSLVAGAEAEFFLRLDGKEQFAYLAGAKVFHPVKKNQLTKQYFINRLSGTGRVLSRSQRKFGQNAPQLFGVKRYLLKQYALALFQYLFRQCASGRISAFYARCKLAVIEGQIKEDFVAHYSRRQIQA